MFYAECIKGSWRIFCGARNICGAVDERVARETAAALNAYRAIYP